VDKLDSANFPRSGYAGSAHIFASTHALGADDTYTRWDADFLGVRSIGPHTLQAALKAGGAIGDDRLPRYDLFSWGGFLQQSGYPTGALLGERLTFGRLVYSYRVREARLFEKGTIFRGSPVAVKEQESLAVGLTGAARMSSLHSATDAGIFELKGVIESVLRLFAASAEDLGSSAAESAAYSNAAAGWVEPGRGGVATLDGREIARFGELASGKRDARKLRQPVFVAEIDLQALYELPLRRVAAREISRYQAVERDFSFIFADSVHWQTIEQAVRGLGIAELTRLAPVEIFRDAKAAAVPAGHYALLVRCVFQSREATLTEDELSRWSSQVMEALTKLGGALRS